MKSPCITGIGARLAGIVLLCLLTTGVMAEGGIWKITHEGFTVIVSVKPHELGSVGAYTVAVAAPAGEYSIVTGERDGTIRSVWVADLNGDRRFQVLVVTQSAGSGSYGAVAIYDWTGAEVVPRKVADLSPAQRVGYQGHDEFRLEGNTLVREFPVYREGDTNVSPTGGRRRLIYNSTANGWEAR